MKRTTLIFIAALVVAMVLSAGNRRKFDIDTHLKNMSKELSLSEKQQELIRPLIEEQKELMTNFDPRKGSESERKQFQEKMNKINEKIYDLLNEEQQEKFDEIKKKMHSKRGQNPRRNN